jgi:hypothetical protein
MLRHNLTWWWIFKCFTAVIGEIGGLCVLVGGVVAVGTSIGMVMTVVGMVMFYLGRNLTHTLLAEDLLLKDDDEGDTYEPRNNHK